MLGGQPLKHCFLSSQLLCKMWFLLETATSKTYIPSADSAVSKHLQMILALYKLCLECNLRLSPYNILFKMLYWGWYNYIQKQMKMYWKFIMFHEVCIWKNQEVSYQKKLIRKTWNEWNNWWDILKSWEWPEKSWNLPWILSMKGGNRSFMVWIKMTK